MKNTQKKLFFLQNQITKCHGTCYKYFDNLPSDIPLVTYSIEVHHLLQKTIPFVTKYKLQKTIPFVSKYNLKKTIPFLHNKIFSANRIN